MARLSGTVLKNAKPARGVPFVTGPVPSLPAAPADDRNWQQRFRDWGNSMGERLLGPHLNEALGRAGQAVQFTDAGDMMDATSSGSKVGRAVQDGRWWDAAKEAPWTLAATAFAAMPGVSVGAADNAAKEAVQGSKKLTADVLPKKIRAFHGSPHDFDRFSLDKIGTGEGAQAYGHGLYFAENEEVAQGYKNALRRMNDEMTFDGKPLKRPRDFTEIQTKLENDEGDWRLYKAVEEITARQGDMNERLSDIRNWYRNQPEMLAAIDRAEQRMSLNANPGSMYEVEINADPDAFLDWDKPLSEQPEAVLNAVLDIPEYQAWVNHRVSNEEGLRKAAIERYGYDPLGQKTVDAYKNPTGAGFYKSLATLKGDSASQTASGDTQAATQRLREAGIPGIKYLDAGSRGAGDGTRNYVVFDDNLINIIRKYGIAGASAMLGYNLLEGMNEAQAAELKKYEPKRLTPEKLKGQRAGR